MSFPAPVVMRSKMISSAMRPRARLAIDALPGLAPLDRLYRSSFGRYQVTPSAGPRGMIVTSVHRVVVVDEDADEAR